MTVDHGTSRNAPDESCRIDLSSVVPPRLFESARWLRPLAFMALALAIVLGCSVERHYKVLSFFFDGVPDPALIAAGRSEVERVRAAGGTVYAHEPYANAQCNECHRGGMGRMKTQVTSAVCETCHKGVSEQHRYMHGPVAAAACLWCHAPHESTVRPMLRADAGTLCRQCHGSSLSPAKVHPAHADTTRSCLECHSGHGGGDRFFLLPAYSETTSQ